MGSLDNLSLAKQILDGLRVPYHIIPGNHDTKWSESGGSDFARLWGDDRFAFESGGFRFIGLSQGPVLRMGDGNWAPQDVRWLEGLLADKASAAKPIIFVSHYPLDPGIANWYVVLDKLKTVPTVAVLVGHGHKNQALDFEGLRGVMGRANIGTKDAGLRLYDRRDRGQGHDLRARERRGGPCPPWYGIELEKNGLPVVAAGRRAGGAGSNPGPLARPDFSVNAAYPASPGALALRGRLDDRLLGGGLRRYGRLRRRFGRGPGPARPRRQHRLGVQDGRPDLFDPRGRRRPGRLRQHRRDDLRPGRPDRDACLEGRDRRAGRRQSAHRRRDRLYRLRRPRLPRHRPGQRPACLEPRRDRGIRRSEASRRRRAGRLRRLGRPALRPRRRDRPGHLDVDRREPEPVLRPGRLLARRGQQPRLHRRAESLDDGPRARHGAGALGDRQLGRPRIDRHLGGRRAASTSGRPTASSRRSLRRRTTPRPSGRRTPDSTPTSTRPCSSKRTASSSTGRRTGCSSPSTARPGPSSGSTGSASRSSTP